MNIDKQIEEMAKLLHLNYDMPYEFSKGLAEFLIDEGWCKASEVFEEIEEVVKSRYRSNKGSSEDSAIMIITKHSARHSFVSVLHDIAELKKKYTKSEKDDV